MSDGTAYGGEPADAREAIMHATYRALQKHSYAGLSIQRIADETDLSKSTFYHHFDGKNDLLLAFADYMLEEFTRGMAVESTDDPVEDLFTFLNLIVGVRPTARDAPDHLEVMGTYLELRSQAIRDPAFREKFTETSDDYVDRLADIIEDGIEAGVFREVDAERVAGFVLTIVDGILLEATTRTDDPRAELWRDLEAFVATTLLPGDSEEVAVDAAGPGPRTRERGHGLDPHFRQRENAFPPGGPGQYETRRPSGVYQWTDEEERESDGEDTEAADTPDVSDDAAEDAETPDDGTDGA